ncbi:hypothetical protein [Streptomyces sp. RB17]|uniref:hypothetical protein n=1 Tax=Streptomyces sp. RB17 TaxID=2585197 RepID=UPI001294E136|nr:hypothetical protein [Streptomyces sp. RB17]
MPLAAPCRSCGVFAVGKAPAGGQVFDEALCTAGPLAVTGASVASTTWGRRHGDHTAPRARSDAKAQPSAARASTATGTV